MAIKLQIHPSSSSLDLLGPPDRSSAYSLSGHISLSLTFSRSLFERRRAIRLLLRSLVITFEGQAELVTQESGYAAARLCSISRELVSSRTTVELSNEGHEDGDAPCTWHIMFDLPIPGWLPASDVHGDCRESPSGIQYNLYATAKFTSGDEASVPSSWISALCTPFSFRNKVVHAERCEITLNRFALPPRSPFHKSTLYSITPNEGTPCPEGNPHRIPPDIVSKLELLASIPDCISVNEEEFPFALSIRASALSESQASKLRVSQLSLELQQDEQYTSSANAYAARYPLPSEKNQPPTKALRHAHPVHTLYDIGLLASPLPFIVDDAHSLLPGAKRIDIRLNSANHAGKCAEGIHPDQWFTMETRIPFTRSLPERKDDRLEWAGTPRLRETSEGPFFGVKHSLYVVVTLSYDGVGDDGKPPTSHLAFTLPLRFARFRGTGIARSGSPLSQSSSPERLSLAGAPTLPTTMPSSQPYHVPELPAYSQLFHPNGDVKHDDSIPLPLYTPSPDVSKDGYSTSEDSESCLLQRIPSPNSYTL
ncbi:hypothetical protein BJV74DRAFT_792558 [Russula compacta]|nr:hypothetical protein BJV74DRAFT_792558 [Russula compacta]